jgi:hypothetical protein
MSQPTLSRLENAPSWRVLARMGLSMIDLFCDSFERVPQRIVLDIDDTPDTVHGGQQLALFCQHGLKRMQDPSLSQSRPRLGCLAGTLSPSRRQMRSTLLWLTCQPSNLRSAVIRR